MSDKMQYSKKMLKPALFGKKGLELDKKKCENWKLEYSVWNDLPMIICSDSTRASQDYQIFLRICIASKICPILSQLDPSAKMRAALNQSAKSILDSYYFLTKLGILLRLGKGTPEVR